MASDGSAQGLVTRGTYRSLDAPGAEHSARFQIAPQGYHFPAGHRLKLEVAANDAPYYQQSNVPAVVQVAGVQLTLPLYEERSTAASRPPSPATARVAAASGLPATGGSDDTGVALAALGLALLLGRTRLRSCVLGFGQRSPRGSTGLRRRGARHR